MTTLHPMPDGVAPAAIDIAKARNEVPGAYEDTVPKLDGDKLMIKERLDAGGRPVSSFDDTRRTALAFLANPCNLWDTERLGDRCAVARLTFAIQLHDKRKEGFRIANLMPRSCPLAWCSFGGATTITGWAGSVSLPWSAD